MDIYSLAAMGAKYILKLVSGSKTFDKAKEDTLGKSWTWVKQHVFNRNPSLEEQINQGGEKEAKQQILTRELSQLLHDDNFAHDFQEWIKSLQADPTIRNYFDSEITELEGNINVGDRLKPGSPSQDQGYDMKNIALGKIGKMKGNFNVGDKEI